MAGNLNFPNQFGFPLPSLLLGRLFLIGIFLFLEGSLLFAQEEIFERYDPNTEITLQGKVVEIWVVPKRPVIIGVKKQERVYQVVLAPKWFIVENHIEIDYQDEVLIRGAKFFAPDGNLLILAKTLDNLRTKKRYLLRDEFLKPCWRRGPFGPPYSGRPFGPRPP